MTDIIDRLNEHAKYGYMPNACRVAMQDAATALATARAEAEALRREVERLKDENASLRHWAWGHIDALLLYAAGSYPNDSHVKDAVAFCRLLKPTAKLRMDPLKASDFHPATAALSKGPTQ